MAKKHPIKEEQDYKPQPGGQGEEIN